MLKPKQNQAGFSLVEIIVTLFIMGVVFLVYNASANTLSLNRNTKDQETAFRIAEGEIGLLRASGYSSLPASGNINDPQLANLPHGAVETVTVTVYTSNSKNVTAQVFWNEPGNGIQHSVKLTTLVTKGGLGS